MSLKLYFHPLSSYSHKALIALYETGTPFEPVILNDAASREAFLKISPLGKFPVVRDEAQNLTILESTIIIEYLAQHYPKAGLIPTDPDAARETRLRDRFYDLYVHTPMQQLVGHVLRPADKKDPLGIEQPMKVLHTAYGLIEQEMSAKRWAMGDQFTMADCAAAPALFYADKLSPLTKHPRTAAYLDRLKQRPSYARALKEMEPYWAMFPIKAPLV